MLAQFSLLYCQSCLTPNTRPNGKFNSDGICTACEYYDQVRLSDFDLRLAELQNIVSRLTKHRKNKKWNCIVGVSGGKDSTRQALWVRDKLGLRPLLVSVMYPPRQISDVGTRNISNLINLGFDCVSICPAPRSSQELVREAFFRFANWNKATEMALFSGVPQVALDKGIDLILWGENGALQVGDTGVLASNMWDGDRLRHGDTLDGGDLTWLIDAVVSVNRVAMYTFPDERVLNANQIRTIFLGPAWSDWSSKTNSEIALLHGFSPRDDSPQNTGDIYGTEMIDEDWMVVNSLMKYYKLGFARGTEQANSLIRSGAITRDAGINLAEKQDSVCGDYYLESFCRYINISVLEFWEVIRKFANPGLFEIGEGAPRPLFKPGIGII